MKGNDISLEEMNLNALNLNHEFEIDSDVENENLVGQVPKFEFNTISNQDENSFQLKEEKRIDNNPMPTKSSLSSKLLKFSKIKQLKNSELFKWIKARNSPKPITSPKAEFKKFQIKKQGQSYNMKFGRCASRNSNDYKNSNQNISDSNDFKNFKERQIRLLSKAEMNLKTLTQQREFELQKECTFIPKIQRVSSQKGFVLQGLQNSEGFQILQNIKFLNNNEINKKENKIQNPQVLQEVEASLTFDTFNNQSNVSFSKKEKQQFTNRIKEDIHQMNSIQRVPQINPKSKKIIEEKKLKAHQLSQNVFDKLCVNKEQGKPMITFPFKPQINSPSAISYIPSNNLSQKKLDFALKKHEKLLLKLKEKQSNYEFNTVKKNEMSTKFQIRKFNKELEKMLITLRFDKNKLSKDNIKELLLKMNFLSKRQTSKEFEKFEDLWAICKGKNEDNAKIQNLKAVLMAISGLINLSLGDTKEESASKNKFYKVENYDFQSRTLCICQNAQREIISHENKNDFVNQFIYDNEGILLLSYTNILSIKRRFVSLYCNRFSMIGKKSENIIKCESNHKEEKLEVNMKYRVITSQRKQKYKGKTKPILKKSSINEFPEGSKSKKDIIVALASISPKNKKEALENKKSDLDLKNKRLQRMSSLKIAKMRNKSAEEIDFEKSRNNLTFSPLIHEFSTQNVKSNKLTKFQENSIQRIRMGHKAKSPSQRVILSQSKEGITSLKCDSNIYRKYCNQFKCLEESDKTLKKLVKKYVIESHPEKQFHSPNDYPMNGKIKEGISLELLNFYKENQAIQNSKRIENEKLSKANEEESFSQLENASPDKNIANQNIAVIKINRPEGVSNITVNRNSKIAEIASQIAIENNLTELEKAKILSYLEGQVKSKI